MCTQLAKVSKLELLQAAVLLRAEKLRISNTLLLNKPSGLGGETRMLTNIMLHIAATRQSINVGVMYITAEDKGYVQSSHTKSVCLLL